MQAINLKTNCVTVKAQKQGMFRCSYTRTGADPGGGGGGAPPNIGKNMIFWRKIVILHTKYPKNVRASLRSAQFF